MHSLVDEHDGFGCDVTCLRGSICSRVLSRRPKGPMMTFPPLRGQDARKSVRRMAVVADDIHMYVYQIHKAE